MAKKSAKKKKASVSTDIIKLILMDHKPLKNLIKTMKDMNKDLTVRRKALEQFVPLLINHAQSEERALYSFMEKKADLREESFEGEVEHELAELMLESISLEKNEDMWSAKVKVLAELVEHHLKEEETVVFPDIREQISMADRKEMGERYIDFKEQYDLPIEINEEEVEDIDLSSDDDENDVRNFSMNH